MYQSNYSNNANPNYAAPMSQGSQQQQVMQQLIMRPVPGTGPPPGSGPAYGLPTTEPLNFIRPLDQRKFEQLFAGGSLDGLRIGGDAARDILQRSKLPNAVLARIWSLADTRNAGSLTFPEFAVAMYLANLAVQGTDVPDQLPARIRDEVSRIMNAPGGLVRVTDPGKGLNPHGVPLSGPVQMTNVQAMPVNTMQAPPPPSSSSSSAAAIMPMGALSTYGPSSGGVGVGNYGSQLQPYQASAPSNALPGSFMPPGSASNVPWAVTPEEKAAYDQVFAAWDTRGIGFISGETARQIFSQSGLGQSALAQVWQLADIHNHGKLNADEFAVAMHLIHRALAGQPVPYRLSPDLIPPSTRDLSDSVSALKNSLVQDIVQQRHMSAAYGGSKFAGTSGLGRASGSMRPSAGRTRDSDDWDSVYRPPRMGDVRQLDDDDLFGEIESYGYRSANRRKPPPRRKADDPWGNLRSTAERYGTPSMSSSGASTPLAGQQGAGAASQETVAELRKQLGEQRILLEALSYSAGEPDAQYVTDEERKAREDMREVALKVRELEKRIAIAEGAPSLEKDDSGASTDEVAPLSISLEKMDLSRFTPAAMADNPDAKPSASTTTTAAAASSTSKVDAAIAASRAPPAHQPSPPVSSSASSSSAAAQPSDPEAIKNRAAELLAQRMAALTGKAIPVASTAKPAEPETPSVEETPEPAKEATPTMSSRLASATTKEERQKIIQEQAERRMKEREKFLRETMGHRFPSSPTASQTAATTTATTTAAETSEQASKPAENTTASAPPPPQPQPGSNNPFRAMAATAAAEDEEVMARRKQEEAAEAERQRAAAREEMLSNAKAARERAQQAEKDALLQQATATPARPSRASAASTVPAPAADVVKATEAGRSPIAEEDRAAVAEAARNARAQISSTFKTQGSDSARSSTSEWDMVNKQEAATSSSSTTANSTADAKKAEVDAAVAAAASALFGQGASAPAAAAAAAPSSTTAGSGVVWAGSFEARALYEYHGQNADDLSLAAGDVILVQPCADTESPWWYARKLKGAQAGAEGWFPISYVERLDGDAKTTEPAPVAAVRGQILYDFAAQDTGEISVAAGQTVEVLAHDQPDWWRIRCNGQEGLVPAAYVQLEQ
ncbi:hypothetical protein SYNPS1DRAFT_27893 [Syncephalis pseudoplumigaleata]|uniref:Actin cytoskeleton-regulatory complex protein pan1 n=1 Tax=Syncephalis pseudoplumigaleata TaxID=1712513 RepID=A0A4P9Z1Q6_9FUNG|nr:hypothetical protein SYNPS1DRAFT_27893 [Syncephalis pseudoplumigaleata]|eukprot:RKP26413.1 hypothetical protein SYNPS1DRAFT_27893 [Syncephalis pseudoplumigaleata]